MSVKQRIQAINHFEETNVKEAPASNSPRLTPREKGDPSKRPELTKVGSTKNLLAEIGKQKSSSRLLVPQKTHKPPFIESLAPELQSVLKEWLPYKQFTLLYQAAKDGYEDSQFHELCDNKGPTLCLIQSSEGYLFGGYTPEEWESPDKVIYKTNPLSFIFTLSNPYSLPPTKYLLFPDDAKAQAIKCSKRYGITFGEQAFWAGDIQLSSTNINFNFPVSFVDSTGKGDTTFTGSSRSLLQDILVYSVQ